MKRASIIFGILVSACATPVPLAFQRIETKRSASDTEGKFISVRKCFKYSATPAELNATVAELFRNFPKTKSIGTLNIEKTRTVYFCGQLSCLEEDCYTASGYARETD